MSQDERSDANGVPNGCGPEKTRRLEKPSPIRMPGRVAPPRQEQEMKRTPATESPLKTESDLECRDHIRQLGEVRQQLAEKTEHSRLVAEALHGQLATERAAHTALLDQVLAIVDEGVEVAKRTNNSGVYALRGARYRIAALRAQPPCS